MRGKFAMLLNPEVALRFTVAKQNAMIVVCTRGNSEKKSCASTSQTYKLFLVLSSRGEGLG